jgi:hypothetical protein
LILHLLLLSNHFISGNTGAIQIPLNALRAYALAKMHQPRAVARQFPLKLFHAAKSLVVRIALPLQYNRLITQIL